jgi:hydrogenase maturation protease
MAATPTTGRPANPAVPSGEHRHRTLVAGVGNLFLGDDAFGSEVARALARLELPAGVTVIDYGVRGTHLAYDLLDGWDRLILIDLVSGRGTPGAVHIIDITSSADDLAVEAAGPDPHGMSPQAVLAAVRAMGGTLPPTVLVGCEGADIGEGIGLSESVAAAVRPAAEAVLRLLSAVPAGGR